jgi:hypothetical protein
MKAAKPGSQIKRFVHLFGGHAPENTPAFFFRHALTPNASGKAETEMTVAGGILRPNLPVVGSINAEIVFDGKVKISNQFPVGETNGRMWIPGGGSFSAK